MKPEVTMVVALPVLIVVLKEVRVVAVTLGLTVTVDVGVTVIVVELVLVRLVLEAVVIGPFPKQTTRVVQPLHWQL